MDFEWKDILATLIICATVIACIALMSQCSQKCAESQNGGQVSLIGNQSK